MTRKLTHHQYERLKSLAADLIEDYKLAYPLEPLTIADLLGVHVTVHPHGLPAAAWFCDTDDGYTEVVESAHGLKHQIHLNGTKPLIRQRFTTMHEIGHVWAEPCGAVPERLIAFSEAVRRNTVPDPTAWVHFYEDDYRFERLWKTPEKFLDQLRQFAGVISPDFSLYRNMPTAQKIHNTFRNQLLGAWFQAKGIQVIANVRVSGIESIPYSLAGTPRQSTLALGLHGCTKDPTNRVHVIEEVRLICDLCEPTSLLIYGSSLYGVLDHAQALDIPIHVFAPDQRSRSKHREAA